MDPPKGVPTWAIAATCGWLLRYHHNKQPRFNFPVYQPAMQLAVFETFRTVGEHEEALVVAGSIGGAGISICHPHLWLLFVLLLITGGLLFRFFLSSGVISHVVDRYEILLGDDNHIATSSVMTRKAVKTEGITYEEGLAWLSGIENVLMHSHQLEVINEMLEARIKESEAEQERTSHELRLASDELLTKLAAAEVREQEVLRREEALATPNEQLMARFNRVEAEKRHLEMVKERLETEMKHYLSEKKHLESKNETLVGQLEKVEVEVRAKLTGEHAIEVAKLQEQICQAQKSAEEASRRGKNDRIKHDDLVRQLREQVGKGKEDAAERSRRADRKEGKLKSEHDAKVKQLEKDIGEARAEGRKEGAADLERAMVEHAEEVDRLLRSLLTAEESSRVHQRAAEKALADLKAERADRAAVTEKQDQRVVETPIAETSESEIASEQEAIEAAKPDSAVRNTAADHITPPHLASKPMRDEQQQPKADAALKLNVGGVEAPEETKPPLANTSSALSSNKATEASVSSEDGIESGEWTPVPGTEDNGVVRVEFMDGTVQMVELARLYALKDKYPTEEAMTAAIDRFKEGLIPDVRQNSNAKAQGIDLIRYRKGAKDRFVDYELGLRHGTYAWATRNKLKLLPRIFAGHVPEQMRKGKKKNGEETDKQLDDANEAQCSTKQIEADVTSATSSVPTGHRPGKHIRAMNASATSSTHHEAAGTDSRGQGLGMEGGAGSQSAHKQPSQHPATVSGGGHIGLAPSRGGLGMSRHALDNIRRGQNLAGPGHVGHLGGQSSHGSSVANDQPLANISRGYHNVVSGRSNYSAVQSSRGTFGSNNQAPHNSNRGHHGSTLNPGGHSPAQPNHVGFGTTHQSSINHNPVQRGGPFAGGRGRGRGGRGGFT